MAERTSSMGSKTALAKYLSQNVLTGSVESVAVTHETNRQSAVKEIFVHVFLMSKLGFIEPGLTVGAAHSQYIRASGTNQAAHCAPGQLFYGGVAIQELITNSDDLQISLENLFGRTDAADAAFNKADSRAEENGLRTAFGNACVHLASAAKNARFNRAADFYHHLETAFAQYKSAGVQAYSIAIMRQRSLTRPNDPADTQNRALTIEILSIYSRMLSSAMNTHETVLGLYPEDIWKEYARAR